MTHWREVKIGDLGRIVTGRTPPSSQPELYGDAYPFITPTDIDGQERRVVTARFISEAGRASMERLVLPAKTVAYVCIASVGKVCMVDRPSVTNQQINAVVVDQAQHDASFVFYALRDATPRILAMVGGAATPIINKTAFSEITLRVPCLPVQRRIASILAAYDDLIENNTRRIVILEEISRRIYEEWVVRFRFPGHEGVRVVESELGLVPDGWSVAPLGSVADVQWGDTTVTKKSYVAEGYTAYSAAGPDGLLPYADHNRTGVVLSAIGSCGTTWLATGSWSCIKNTIRFFSSNAERACDEFLFLATRLKSFWPTRGAAQPFISLGDARAQKLVVPSPNVMQAFCSLVRPQLALSANLDRQNRKLRATRDLLLPKLISGALDLSALPEPEVLAA